MLPYSPPFALPRLEFLPRFRYDQLMHFGWKVLIPVAAVWILIAAAGVAFPPGALRGREPLMDAILFYGFALLAVASVVVVIAQRNPISRRRTRQHGTAGTSRSPS